MPLDAQISDARAAALGAPLIDETVLRELIEETGLDLFLAFAARMEASARSHLRDLAAGGEGAARAAHALAGLLGHFGLARAAALARALQGTMGAGPLAGALEAALAESLAGLADRARALAAASPSPADGK